LRHDTSVLIYNFMELVFARHIFQGNAGLIHETNPGVFVARTSGCRVGFSRRLAFCPIRPIIG